MEAIYVIEPGSYVRREGMSLKIVKGSQVVDQIPAEGLKRLTLVGFVSLSGAVLDFLIQNRIETVFMTPTGRFRARLGLDEHRHVALRKAQYLRLSDETFSLETARIVVRGKMENMVRFLVLRARQYNEESLRTTAVQARGMLSLLAEARTLDQVRGLEGASARVYFSCFDQMLRNEAFRFQGRNKRPPLDPVNALLSFVYTLLTNEVLSAVKASGLDPYLGALHEIAYGRPSLACDLVEEYRAFLGDRLVLSLINRKLIGPDDFVYRTSSPKSYVDEEEMKEKRPVEMKPAVNRALIQAYEAMMQREIVYEPTGQKTSYRWLIHQQVRAFARHLEKEGPPYAPFLWGS